MVCVPYIMPDAGDVLRQLRDDRKLTLRALAQTLGVSHSSLQAKEAGITKIKQDELERWAKALGSSADVVLARSGRPPTKAVPVLTEVQAGRLLRGIESEVGWTLQDATEFVQASVTVGMDAFAVRIVGDSMEPRIRPGDICVCEPLHDGDEGRLTQGRVVVAWVEPRSHKGAKAWLGGPIIGRWTLVDQRRAVLTKDNPKYEPVPLDLEYERTPRLAVVVELITQNP